MKVTNEKESKVKEINLQNQQLKVDNTKQTAKIKELEYELQKTRSELD